MKCDKRHILLLLGGMLMLLLTACSSSEENGAVKEQPTFITFYVYAPDRPMPTRAGDDQVNALTAESVIKSLQIWVFTHDDTNQDNDGKLVGYLAPTSFPTTAEGKVYQMEVSKEFANAAPGERPNVDVYVAANTEVLEVLSFDEESTRDALDDASFGNDYFGVSSPPCSSIDENTGLLMSGVLRNQTVVGENPVLRIGDYDHMAKVQLQRVVSKIRFVFSQQKGSNEPLKITGVTLHGKVGDVDYGFPSEEYLFLGNEDYRIGNSYVQNATTILSPSETPLSNIAESNDPADYIYDPSVFATAQDYEDKIIATVSHSDPELTQIGPFYFHETDKKLRGTIDYKIGEGEEQHKDFYMESQSNFYRNHSWIVYAFYGSSGLDVLTVYVNEWTTNQQNHSVYNW